MIVRDIEEEDIQECLEILTELTQVGDISNVNIILEKIKNQNTYIIVMEKKDEIVGMASILIEQKLIHSGGRVGHIEDVVVKRNHRGEGIGKLLIHECVIKAQSYNCYKVILDCSDENTTFYEKCGFHKHGYCMRKDL